MTCRATTELQPRPAPYGPGDTMVTVITPCRCPACQAEREAADAKRRAELWASFDGMDKPIEEYPD